MSTSADAASRQRGTRKQPLLMGAACLQARARGIAIKCFTCVDERAAPVAADCVNSMLACCDKGILERLQQNKAAVAIIGEQQQTPDIPEFCMMRYQSGVHVCRWLSWNTIFRGLQKQRGGTLAGGIRVATAQLELSCVVHMKFCMQ